MGRVLAVEDKDLGKVSLVTSRTREHSDIDLTFAKRPSGDIYKKTEAAAVKQAVKNIVATNRYEKPFQPNFGSNITSMLFELADGRATNAIQDNIRNAIYVYEPRAQVLGVDIIQRIDNNEIKVKITFRVVNTEEVVTLNTTVSRLR